MIEVVCTDRGTHSWRRLGWLIAEDRTEGPVWAAGMVFIPEARRRDMVRAANRNQDARPKQSGGTLRIPACPTCRRTVPMRQETAARVYVAVWDAGLRTLDISLV